MADRVVDIPIGRGEVLRVSCDAERGHEVVKVRRWFPSTAGGLRPSKDGIAIAVDAVPALLAALERVAASAAGASTP